MSASFAFYATDRKTNKQTHKQTKQKANKEANKEANKQNNLTIGNNPLPVDKG